jgi:hypothetical protein
MHVSASSTERLPFSGGCRKRHDPIDRHLEEGTTGGAQSPSSRSSPGFRVGVDREAVAPEPKSRQGVLYRLDLAYEVHDASVERGMLDVRGAGLRVLGCCFAVGLRQGAGIPFVGRQTHVSPSFGSCGGGSAGSGGRSPQLSSGCATAQFDRKSL